MVTFYDIQQNYLQPKVDARKSNRGQWTKPVEFLFSCISMCVGFGNVWRFPYVAYNNGGGTFLMVYFIILFAVSRPLYYFELALGQFCGKGPIKVWKCVPLLKGVGFAQLVSVSYVIIFYNYLLAISIFYLFSSFQSPLPWSVPDERWALTCNFFNITHSKGNESCNRLLPQDFYENHVLKSTNSFNWKLAGCLTFSWIIVYLCIIKSVSSLGKVAYFTSIYPYVILVSLLIVSLMQEGAINGILYFLTPDWKRLSDPMIWYKAVEQSFFSLNVCFGSVLMYSSYNRFDNNIYRDSIIISVVDTLTSILAGCVVFAALGSIAHMFNTDISLFLQMKGEELVFIVYPRVLSTLTVVPGLWSVMFFLMLFVLGIGSSVSQIETILTCIREQFTGLMKRKYVTALVACIFYNVCGFSLTNNYGNEVLKVFNNYASGSGAFLYGITQMVGVMWIYGYQRFCSDVQFMSGRQVGIFWKVCWAFVCPLALLIIFIVGTYSNASNEKASRVVATSGWALTAFALSQIPIWMGVTLSRFTGTLKQRLRQSITASADWGPSDPSHYYRWKNHRILEGEGTIPLSYITLR